ncbi:MAG TPA: copper amine oxidase N-terminal domain-containing protein [Syntrophomonadaceae bacterium]|nr:copper amine oxidase N-terminal domain-containing protein [Syntrophomonadaceae bacterium]
MQEQLTKRLAKKKMLTVLLALIFLMSACAGVCLAVGPTGTVGPGAGTSGDVGTGTQDTNTTNNINNNTNTTNNANTEINISGSTVSNSNIGSNNQVTQSTEVTNTSSITVKQEVSVLVNGQPLQSDTPSFINGDDRTMVTLRAIAEALGAKVDWDPNTQTVTITLGDKVVKLVIGQNSYTVNGEDHSSDTAPGTVNGRTVVPARVVGEALGAKVGWNADTATVTVDGSSSGSQQGTSSTSQTTPSADWQAKFPIYPTQGDNFKQPSTTVRTNAKLSSSGLFEANTTINLNEENYSIKVKVNITAMDANGNTLFTGGKEYTLQEKMPLDQWTLQLPADIMPKVTNVNIQQLKLSSQQLDQNPAGASAPQPLTAYNKNDNINLIGTFHMESNATLDLTTGKLDVRTKTYDTDPAFGFTGAVQVGVRDSGGNLLWTSTVHTFGVDCPAVETLSMGAKKSSREDDWSETAPGNILSKAVTLEIKQAHDKGVNLF